MAIPDAWLFRAELYFAINLLIDAKKMMVSMISFSSAVVNWFRWTDNRKKVENWNDLKTRMFEFY